MFAGIAALCRRAGVELPVEARPALREDLVGQQRLLEHLRAL
jgi:hypothetical protein